MINNTVNALRITPSSKGGCQIERYTSQGLWVRPDWTDAGMPSLNAIFFDHAAAVAALGLAWPCEAAPAGFRWIAPRTLEEVGA